MTYPDLINRYQYGNKVATYLIDIPSRKYILNNINSNIFRINPILIHLQIEYLKSDRIYRFIQ